MKTRITKNKIVGAVLLTMALFGFAVFVYRLSFYIYEYDAQYSPVDYGKFNILSYFTVQSNFFAYVYFLFAGLAIFGVKKAEKIGFSTTFGALITLYVLVAGVTYCAGIPLKLTPPFQWDTAYHRMSAVIQIYYHMIIPPAALLLWCFPFRRERLEKRCVLLSGVYPLVYSLFSLVRGRFSDPVYYPYPFYDPAFVWRAVMKERPLNLIGAYGLIALLLVFGVGLFMGLCAVLVRIHNARVQSAPPAPAAGGGAR